MDRPIASAPATRSLARSGYTSARSAPCCASGRQIASAPGSAMDLPSRWVRRISNESAGSVVRLTRTPCPVAAIRWETAASGDSRPANTMAAVRQGRIVAICFRTRSTTCSTLAPDRIRRSICASIRSVSNWRFSPDAIAFIAFARSANSSFRPTWARAVRSPPAIWRVAASSALIGRSVRRT